MTNEYILEDGGVEDLMIIPNLLMLLVVVFYLLIAKVGPDKISPLVVTDATTSSKIAELERKLDFDPQGSRISGAATAIELSRLYDKAGQIPLAYDTLRRAEQEGSRSEFFRMQLGAAFLDLGKNIDGIRVLERALTECELQKCAIGMRVKMEIFLQVAQELIKRGINAHEQPAKANKVFREILKRVDNKLLPKPPKTEPKNSKAASQPA